MVDRIRSIGRGTIGPFNDIMIIPTLNETLISVGSLADKGLISVFMHDKLNIYTLLPNDPDTRIILSANRDKHGLYYFNDIDEVFTTLRYIETHPVINMITTRSGTSLPDINPKTKRAKTYVSESTIGHTYDNDINPSIDINEKDMNEDHDQMINEDVNHDQPEVKDINRDQTSHNNNDIDNINLIII